MLGIAGEAAVVFHGPEPLLQTHEVGLTVEDLDFMSLELFSLFPSIGVFGDGTAVCAVSAAVIISVPGVVVVGVVGVVVGPTWADGLLWQMGGLLGL